MLIFIDSTMIIVHLFSLLFNLFIIVLIFILLLWFLGIMKWFLEIIGINGDSFTILSSQ